MSEQNQPQPEAPPPWLNDLTNALGAELQQQRAQINALAQQVQRPVVAQRPAPPPPPASDVRERILQTIVNEPERFVAEVVGFANQTAEQRLEERLRAERAMMQQSAVEQSLWHQFYSANPDLQVLTGEVWSEFMNTNPNLDFSTRANTARETVRQKMAAYQHYTQEMEKRERDARRMAAGAPGAGMAGGAGADPAEAARSEAERTADAIAERRQMRAQKSGDKLRDTSEYFEAMKQSSLARAGQAAMRGRRVA